MVNVLIKCMNGSFTINLNLVKKFAFLWENLQDENGLLIEYPNMKSQSLQKVIAYCEYSLDFQPSVLKRPLISLNLSQNGASDFEIKLMNCKNIQELMEIVEIAKAFNLKNLEDLGCAKIASLLKGKSEVEMMEILN